MASHDFADTVEEYLADRRIYRPADEFISKLALCSRCMGGGDKLKYMRELILQMVALVKSKSEENRNNHLHKTWLKQAAKAVEMYQLEDRAWISDNIWKLPKLPSPVEQEFDPTKGKRDIRYYPTPSGEESMEAPLGEEPMECQENIDEEALLASSPSVSPNSICANSPVRRSPRIAGFRTSSSTSVKTTMLESRASSSTKASSTVTGSRTSSSTSVKPTMSVSRTSSSTKASSTVTGSRTSSSTSVKPTMSESRTSSSAKASSTVTGSRTSSSASVMTTVSESRTSSSTKVNTTATGSRTSSSTGAKVSTSGSRTSSSTSGEVISGSSVLKRPAPIESLKISVLTGKHADEEHRKIELAYGQRKDRKPIQCWVQECNMSTTYLKVHSYRFHIPSIFDERLNPSDLSILKRRRSALLQAARWLLGKPSSLDELIQFVGIQKMLQVTDNSIIMPSQAFAMQEFCKFLKVELPKTFTLFPCNSVGILIHWKVVLLMAASLAEDERQFWFKTYKSETGQPEPETKKEDHREYPKAFDAHFHLDRTLDELELPSYGSLDDILAKVTVKESKRVTLQGAVTIYCDPESYPSDKDLGTLPDHIQVGVGYHPRHARYHHGFRRDVSSIERLLKHPKVIALGEIGIDHTEPMKYWARQVEVLEKILPLLEDRHVLVLHCRGMMGDDGTEAYLLMLHFLRKHVRSRHPIHLHCFTGDQYVVTKWLKVFPKTLFGFTNLVNTFSDDQIKALQQLKDSQILLESDAPYFPVRSLSKTSTPGLLKYVADAVAQHRRTTGEKILEITVKNGKELYKC